MVGRKRLVLVGGAAFMLGVFFSSGLHSGRVLVDARAASRLLLAPPHHGSVASGLALRAPVLSRGLGGSAAIDRGVAVVSSGLHRPSRPSRLDPAVPAARPAALLVAVECVSQAIAGEARGEVDTGEVGVANVVVNRIKAWGGGYCQRVYDRNGHVCQFDGACRHHVRWPHDVADRAHAIALAAVTGHLRDVTGGALYFKVCPARASRDSSFTRRIDHHCYYREYPEPRRARFHHADTHGRHRAAPMPLPLARVTDTGYRLVSDRSRAYGYRLIEMERM